MRVAFIGASGTGKTTLASWVEAKYGVPLNPVGSRSVARDMGFDNPYDVDAAGRRAEFQWRLMQEKVSWEASHDAFVTDRTTFDNLLYTALHDVYSINEDVLSKAQEGMRRYTHVIYCPVSAFVNTAGDTARIGAKMYHRIYDAALQGFLGGLTQCDSLLTLHTDVLAERKTWIQGYLRDR